MEDARDVLEELGLCPGRPRLLDPQVQRKKSALLAAMGFEPVDTDTICDRAGLTPAPFSPFC